MNPTQDLKDLLPAEMLKYPNWICFNRATKVPINPRTGGNAMSNNPSTWTDFDTAYNSSVQSNLGIGFEFVNTDICGIDIDHCIDSNNNWTDIAKDIYTIMNIGAYIEVSISGTGLHIMCRGKIPDGERHNHSNGVEMYSTASAKYFTISGYKLSGGTNIPDSTEQLAIVHKKYLHKEDRVINRTNVVPLVTDHPILDVIRRAKDAEKFFKLWNGDFNGYPSQSEADIALCMKLAFYLQGDSQQIDNLFRCSGLMRPKWDEKRGVETYGEMTIQNAIRQTPNFYKPKEKTKYTRKNLKGIPRREMQYIQGFGEFFPLGKISLLYGDYDNGKSFITCALVAHLTRQKQYVIMQNSEDSDDDTIIPRLEDAGADMDYVVTVAEEEGTPALSFTDPRMLQAFEDYNPIAAIFDPWVNYCGDKFNMNAANEVRAITKPIKELASKYNCAIIILAHINKSTNSGSGNKRITGSGDLPAMARSSILCGKDPENPKRGAMIHTKANLATDKRKMGYEWRHVDGNPKRPFVIFTQDTDLTEEMILGNHKDNKYQKFNKPNPPTDIVIVESFLRERLQDGASHEVYAVVQEAEAQKIYGIWDYLRAKQLPFVEYHKGHEFGAKWVIRLLPNMNRPNVAPS